MKYLGILAALALTACSSSDPATPPTGDASAGTADSGGDGGAGAYPPSPYGTDVGDTMPDLAFDGWKQGDYDVAKAAETHLSEFYDPSGAAGRKLLVINVCSVWCLPCKNAFDAFKDKAAGYAAQGATLLSVLYENAEVKPIALPEAAAYAKDRGVAIPMFIDPAYQLSQAVRPPEVPSYIIVSARDMKVLGTVKNAIDAPPWAFVDQKLAEIH
jgi:hypothetical protein